MRKYIKKPRVFAPRPKQRGGKQQGNVPDFFQVMVQGPDGNQSLLSIWVPLSIMAASSARANHQSEAAAQAAQSAVVEYGNKLREAPLPCRPDFAGEVRNAASLASRSLVVAGGSRQAGAIVRQAVEAGGRLLMPYLESNQTIRLDRHQHEQRDDAAMDRRNVSCSPLGDVNANVNSGLASAQVGNASVDGDVVDKLTPHWDGDVAVEANTIKDEHSYVGQLLRICTPLPKTTDLQVKRERCCDVNMTDALPGETSAQAGNGPSAEGVVEDYFHPNLILHWDGSVAAETRTSKDEYSDVGQLLEIFAPLPKTESRVERERCRNVNMTDAPPRGNVSCRSHASGQGGGDSTDVRDKVSLCAAIPKQVLVSTGAAATRCSKESTCATAPSSVGDTRSHASGLRRGDDSTNALKVSLCAAIPQHVPLSTGATATRCSKESTCATAPSSVGDTRSHASGLRRGDDSTDAMKVNFCAAIHNHVQDSTEAAATHCSKESTCATAPSTVGDTSQLNFSLHGDRSVANSLSSAYNGSPSREGNYAVHTCVANDRGSYGGRLPFIRGIKMKAVPPAKMTKKLSLILGSCARRRRKKTT